MAKVLAGAGGCFQSIPAFQQCLASPTLQPQAHNLIVFCNGAQGWVIWSTYNEGANAVVLKGSLLCGIYESCLNIHNSRLS